MDPEVLLSNIRLWVSKILDPDPEQDSSVTAAAAVELAEDFQALDGWLSNGGFSPMDWRHRIDSGDVNRA